MLYFLHPNDDTATAETDASATRLTQRGFLPCTLSAWRAARQRSEARRRVELAAEDAARRRRDWRATVLVPVRRKE